MSTVLLAGRVTSTSEVIDRGAAVPILECMSLADARTGTDVMTAFIPACPLAAKLGIIAEVLDGDEVRLRMPFDPTNTTLGDMVHGGAIATLADMTVMAAAWAGADVPDSLRGVTTSLSM